MKTGIELITDEMKRMQARINEGGLSVAKGELREAATYYCGRSTNPFLMASMFWPVSWNGFFATRMPPGIKRDLARAGALILMELERLEEDEEASAGEWNYCVETIFQGSLDRTEYLRMHMGSGLVDLDENPK